MIPGFNWWIVANVQTMAVDNVSVSTMDLSTLPATTAMVEWREGRGELQTTTPPTLRTIFYDMTPYAPFFQQFMTLLPGINLAQAQKIQLDLVDMLYDSKRQLPYSFKPASSPTASWSTLDADIAAMSMIAIPGIAGAATDTTGATSLIAQINTMIDQINNNIVGPGNTVASDCGSFQGTYNAAVSQMNTYLKQGPQLALPATGPAFNVAQPGLPGASIGSSSVSFPGPSNITHLGGVGSSPPITMPWSPIGALTPVTLTMTDITNLMSGISARRQTLLNTRYSKQAAIRALATVAAVIAYSVTAGW